MMVSPFSATWRSDVAKEINNPDFSDKTIIGPARIDTAAAALVLRDPTNSGNTAVSYLEFRQANNIRTGWIGDGSSVNQDLHISADVANLQLLTQNGSVILGNGKLQFPAAQQASSDPNTLDDYEEGTWIPTWSNATTDPGSVTYDSANRYGIYTKIGRIVFVSGRIRTTAITVGSASGQTRIAGLPFAVSGGLGYSAISLGYASVWTTQAPTVLLAVPGSTAIYCYFQTATSMGTIGPANYSTVSGGNDVIFAGFYNI